MLKNGQELYRQKKYHGALQCFNHVISQNDNSLSTALDNRAATHIKLGDFKAALRDGRRIIKEEKTSSMGYLRTGKVLRLLGEDESALRIYIYGVGNVPSNDANINLLQNEYDKMIKLSKARDPLKVLPLELVTMIIKFISFPNMVELLRVSKLWSSVLGSMPMNWNHLDFSRTDKQVSMSALRQYVQRSRGTVTQASIHLSKKHHGNTLKFITLKCKSLNRINILSGHPASALSDATSHAIKLKTLIVSNKCTTNLIHVAFLLRGCKGLDRAEFHSCDTADFASWGVELFKILSLTINAGRSCPGSGSKLDLPSLLEKVPDAQYLSLKHWNWGGFNSALFNFDFSHLNHLRSLDMAHSENFCFPLLPVSIETLDFSSCLFDPSSLHTSESQLMANHLPALTGLSIADHYHIATVLLMSLLEPNKGKLKTLNIKGCHNLTVLDLAALIQKGFLSTVTQLGLGFSEVGDETIELLATNSQHLRILDLDSTKVTGIGVKALALRENRTLERLVLRNCAYVSIDAVEYARSLGVNVDFSFPDARRQK